ncbi:MAG TPA: TetR/AcrR family transcriptional regulator [Rhizomicrobium sp.]|nr:TetR/AcrR family transcriptional regulator [Rhizomicrobium sp.]
MSEPAPRWQRRKQARPQEILDAALAAFAAKGFAATRMEDIAERAGVTKGTIYLYFESKEAVFKSLVRESIGGQIEQVTKSIAAFEGKASDLLRFVLTTLNNFLQTSDRAVLPKIFLAEAGNFPELLRFYREEIIDRGLRAMSGVVARGIAQGEFRKIDPEHGARLCIAPLLMSLIWRTTIAATDRGPFDYDAFLQTHLDTLLRGLAK